MANKIDLTKTEAAQLANADLDYLKANGARALPNSPSASGWSAEAIKKQLYKQPEILFAWLKRLAESQLDLGGKINDYLDDIGSGGEFPLVFDTLANAQAAVSAGEVKAGSIVFVSNGSDIKAYYCGDGGLVSVGGDLVHKSGVETITGKKTFTAGASFTAGNVNFGSSGSDNSKQLDIYYATNLRGPVTSNTIIPGNTFALGSAEHYWGSAYIDDLFLYGVISDGMHEWAFPSKNGTIVLDSDITKSALETTLGAASSSSNGYMSSSDKAHLDALYALLGSESDADSVVDTINEVLSVFNQYPEGVELATVLAGKVGYSDIVDVLNSTATNKALSANQGKELGDRLTIVESDYAPQSTTYTKTETDALLAAKVSVSDIVDNLVSTDSDKPLSANQGRILNDSISDLKDLLYEISVSEAAYATTSDVFAIPQTIDSNRVLVSPGCVLSKLKGNTASFNQLVRNPVFANGTNYWYTNQATISASGGKLSITPTTRFGGAFCQVPTIAGHIYLALVSVTLGNTAYTRSAYLTQGSGTIEIGAMSMTREKQVIMKVITATNTQTCNFSTSNGGTENWVADVYDEFLFIDLTLTGEESLTLDQLKAKYNKPLPYNAGSLYSPIVSNIESWGANLFDGELALGYINPNTGVETENNTYVKTKNFTPVRGGMQYSLNEISGLCAGKNGYVVFYDENSSTVGYQSIYTVTPYPFTVNVPTNATKLRVLWSFGAAQSQAPALQIMLNLGSTAQPYKPYVGKLGTISLPSAPITLRGVNTSQDEISFIEDGQGTYTAKIARKIGTYTFTGNETWLATGSGYIYYTFAIENSIYNEATTSNIGNVRCGSLAAMSFDTLNQSGSSGIATTGKRICISASDYANLSSLVGKTIDYELATPTEEILATGLTYEQVSLLFEEGGYIQVENANSDYTHADTELAFAVKRAD